VAQRPHHGRRYVADLGERDPVGGIVEQPLHGGERVSRVARHVHAGGELAAQGQQVLPVRVEAARQPLRDPFLADLVQIAEAVVVGLGEEAAGALLLGCPPAARAWTYFTCGDRQLQYRGRLPVGFDLGVAERGPPRQFGQVGRDHPGGAHAALVGCQALVVGGRIGAQHFAGAFRYADVGVAVEIEEAEEGAERVGDELPLAGLGGEPHREDVPAELLDGVLGQGFQSPAGEQGVQGALRYVGGDRIRARQVSEGSGHGFLHGGIPTSCLVSPPMARPVGYAEPGAPERRGGCGGTTLLATISAAVTCASDPSRRRNTSTSSCHDSNTPTISRNLPSGSRKRTVTRWPTSSLVTAWVKRATYPTVTTPRL